MTTNPQPADVRDLIAEAICNQIRADHGLHALSLKQIGDAGPYLRQADAILAALSTTLDLRTVERCAEKAARLVEEHARKHLVTTTRTGQINRAYETATAIRSLRGSALTMGEG